MNEEQRPDALKISSAARPAPPDYSPKTDDNLVAAIIPYRNQSALIGYYLGVFGLIPCLGLPLALAAIPLGIAGIRRYRREPRVRGIVHAWVAIILGSISSILWVGLIVLMIYGSMGSG